MTKGERIRELRISKNISQTELADMIGQSKQTVYKYETNIVTNIPSDVIEKIALALGTTPSYIFGWDEKSEPVKTDPLDIKILELFAQLTPENKEIFIGKLVQTIASQEKK